MARQTTYRDFFDYDSILTDFKEGMAAWVLR